MEHQSLCRGLSPRYQITVCINPGTPEAIMYPVFALAGIGWATINVNSFPMVVELCSDGDVGKYTGYYYTASMAAQIVTPVLSGALMDLTGKMTVLFPYAAIFVALAFVTMFLTKHGDAKPAAKKGYTVVQAVAPKAELMDYPIILRAMTQGRGSFEFKVTGYDVVPANITQKVVAENKID